MTSTELLGLETCRPGFGRAIDYVPKKSDIDYVGDLYPNGLTGYIPLQPLTLREIAMIQLMIVITDKVNWHKKIFDKSITDKWETEAMADGTYTKKMTAWCIEELKFKARDFEKTGFISVYHGILKSDSLIHGNLRTALQIAVEPLEDVPPRQKDWHPGSDEQVLDLVHPSLYPLIYGRSRVLKFGSTSLDDCIKRCGEGETITLSEDERQALIDRSSVPSLERKEYSTNFQWLPCEVDISGERARITTYINNLHPEEHRDLYGAIDQIITHVLPMWSATLWPLRQNPKPRIEYHKCVYDPDPWELPPEVGPQREDGETEEDYYERRERWDEDIRQVVLPEPEDFVPPEDYAIPSLKSEFKSLQIIVKLANIELTPEKPEYAGGSWHVEGQLNEHICATALFYYSCHNITTSQLAFRQQGDHDAFNEVSYEQYHHDWLQAVFGIEHDSPSVQVVGALDTIEGRVITFPNILQHQVQPFKLHDPSKPGHRKILALFLVDPNIKVLSTANVPCQQKSWWRDATTTAPSLSQTNPDRLGELPLELQDEIFQGVEGFPISLEEAKEFRIKLIEERKSFVVDNTSRFERFEVSLCEH